MRTSRLYIDPDYIARAAEDDKFAVAFARIETHYFTNKGFLQYEGQLLKEATKLNNIKGVIVQGRYDVVCQSNENLQELMCIHLYSCIFLLVIEISNDSELLDLTVNFV
jgi:hypothetical protein